MIQKTVCYQVRRAHYSGEVPVLALTAKCRSILQAFKTDRPRRGESGQSGQKAGTGHGAGAALARNAPKPRGRWRTNNKGPVGRVRGGKLAPQRL